MGNLGYWEGPLCGKDNPNWKNRTLIKKCEICGKIFQTFYSHNCRFCSVKCRGKWQKISGIKKGKNNAHYGVKYFGKENSAWRGGVTPLRRGIRYSREHELWRKAIFQRDKYTCVECGQVGGELHPHHIKEFVIILREFLQKYNQFSPIEDRETLLRLSFTYEPFWDIDNGITLCKKCHKLTFNYKCKNIKKRGF